MLPKDLAKLVPKSHLMTEAEWRGMGVQQSQGWIHYMIHMPGINFIENYYDVVLIYCQYQTEPHILLFRRPITAPPPSEENES